MQPIGIPWDTCWYFWALAFSILKGKEWLLKILNSKLQKVEHEPMPLFLELD
jgi:hypothetical protein